jgi:hypothetical protein
MSPKHLCQLFVLTGLFLLLSVEHSSTAGACRERQKIGINISMKEKFEEIGPGLFLDLKF